MSRNHWTAPAVVFAAVLLPALASADSGLFVGASVGSSHFKDEINGFDLDTNATAYRFIGGLQLGDYLGVEAGYHNFGEFSESIDIGPLPSRARLSADGWTLGGTLGLPIGEQFSIFGRAGMFFWDADVELDGLSIDVPEDENPYYGGGARFKVSPNLSLVGDWTRYELDTVDSDVISLGFTYQFGR